ncbi:TIGR00730 family Rossman fold protein [soil metagenome]
MPNSIRAVTVYCSSSSMLAPSYFDAARQIGRAIAAQKWSLVYGGGNTGLMGAVADAVAEAGGKVVGIMPRSIMAREVNRAGCDEFLVTDCMRTRKAALESRGDAFIALPGGLGTFEEIFEIIVGRQLNTHAKAIVLLNTNQYWEPFRAMVQQGIDQHFIKPDAHDYFHLASTSADAIDYIREFVPTPPDDKWLQMQLQTLPAER